MEDAATNFPLTMLFAGLGGQGVVLAGDTLAEAALLAGLNVKKSEIHGLSRRFGSVSCQVRIGHDLYSPLRGHGGVNWVLALEAYEGLKHLPFLRSDGSALFNRMWCKPGAQTPAVGPAPIVASDDRIEWFEGTVLTHQAECPRNLNFFMLGVLSTRLTIGMNDWHEALQNVTKADSHEVNREMFAAGRKSALPAVATPAPITEIPAPVLLRHPAGRANLVKQRVQQAAESTK